MKKLLIILVFLFCTSTAYAQTTEPTEGKVVIEQSTADACADCFAKSKAKDVLIASLEAELATNKELRAKEEQYNAELLKAVALLTSSEKRTKTFFEKLRQQLGKVLIAATDPKNLATIAALIVVVNNLKK